jgi:hypothetical protein
MHGPRRMACCDILDKDPRLRGSRNSAIDLGTKWMSSGAEAMFCCDKRSTWQKPRKAL